MFIRISWMLFALHRCVVADVLLTHNQHRSVYPFTQQIPLIIQTLDIKSSSVHQRQFIADVCKGKQTQLVTILLRANRSEDIVELAERFARRWQFCRQKFVFVVEQEMVGDDARHWLHRLFRVMWQFKMINVIVVLNKGTQVFVYAQPASNVAVEEINISLGESATLRNLYGATVNVSMEPTELRVIEPGVNDKKVGFYGVDGDLAAMMQDRLVVI